MLTDDEGRAQEIAAELGRVNSERRAREREVDTAAEAARRELPEALREAPGLVLAGEDWHPGVIGIVASRLVERHHRPVVVVSLDGEGGGRGSGRSIPGFDLLAALEACAEHLDSFGGHRAAAGLALRAENLNAFREAFAAHATAVLGPDELLRTQRIDAMVGGIGLGLELAEELGRLAPFGMGNPGVRLMVPSARVSDVRTMGEGKHSRFSLHSGSHRALGVAFGRSSLGVEDDDAVDAAVRLEINHWNGSVEPRVVLNELYPLDDGGGDDAGVRLHSCECADEEWWRRFEAELSRELGLGSAGVGAPLSPTGLQKRPTLDARTVVRGGSPVTVAIAELVSSGAGVLAVCADASRRAALAGGATGLARFNGGAARIACSRCGTEALDGVLGRACGGLALTDYATLLRQPNSVAAHFEHVVLVDPPPSPLAAARAGAARAESGDGEQESNPGFLHLLWTEAEVVFSASVLDEELASRKAVAALFRSLREAGEASGGELREALRGTGAHRRSPEAAARCLRVLIELDLVAGEPSGGTGSVGVVSSEGTDLERSVAFRVYRADHSEAVPYLERPKQP
jgi:single-stranded-DNA-specific exonuclease